MSTLSVNGITAVEIANAIERQIRSGDLLQNATLPSVRNLALQLGVSPNTVAAAYRALRDCGLILTDGRRGTRIAAPLGASTEHAATVPRDLVDLASGNLDGALLPLPDLAWLAHNLRQSGFDQHGDDSRLLALARQWLSSQNLPGLDVGVFSGALDAIERALRARCRPGTCVLIEDPCWPPLRNLLASLRLKPIALAMDMWGAVPPATDILRRASAVVLTPRAQNPTGCSFDAQRWHLWSDAMRSVTDTLLIIDDHWGPLSNAPAVELQSLPEQWVYVLSTSKFLGPDLRLSIASASTPLLQDMQRQQQVGPRWVSLMLQRLAAHLWQRMLETGELRRVSEEYLVRRQALIEALGPLCVGVGSAGEGLHLWLPVIDETSVVQALALQGWAVQAGGPFRLATSPAVRISVSNLEHTDVARLATDISNAVQAPRRPVY